jgi:signal peptidase I
LRKSQSYYAFYEKEEPEEKIEPRVLSTYEWASMMLISLISVFLILGFAFRMVSVKGSSMLPTLSPNNKLVVSNINDDYDYGDIVVVYEKDSHQEPIIKRVIAKGGDTISIDYDHGIVYLNGKELYEPYINEPTHKRPANDIKFPITVPQGYVFLMGDNRNKSTDSRALSKGFIDQRNIYGKAYFRVFPFGYWGIY